jgi:hypothetical protein
MSGLLSLLNKSKKPKPASSDVVPTEAQTKKSEVFTIRILSESQPMETVLELTGDDKSAGSESSFLHWRPNSSASPAPQSPASSTPEPAAAPDRRPAQASPPEEPEHEPDETAAEPEKKKSLGD